MDNVTNLLEKCQDKPDLFNKLFLNRPAYWSRQMDLWRSVVEYRTTVASSRWGLADGVRPQGTLCGRL